MLNCAQISEVEESCPGFKVGHRILFFEAIDSTSEEAARHAVKYEDGTVIVANEQRNGRGSHGHSWSAPAGKALLMSVLLKPPVPAASVFQLALLTSVAATNTLRSFGVDARIGWQNDILVGKRKICGLLTEFKGEIERLHYVILGIGINVSQLPTDFASDLRREATSVEMELGAPVSLKALLRSVVLEVDVLYRGYLATGFDHIREAWTFNNCTLGGQISVYDAAGNRSIGIAQELCTDGSLRVELAGGSCVFLRSGRGLIQ